MRLRHARRALAALTVTLGAAAPAAARPAAAQQPAAQQPPAATASHRAAVQRLLQVARVRELTEQSIQTMLDAQLKQMPQLGPYTTVLRDFYREQLDWAVVEPEFTRVYLEVFTEPEVRELTAFYETPLGQKMIAKMPLVLAKSNELTSRRMQAAMPQLMQRLQAAVQQGGAARPDTARLR